MKDSLGKEWYKYMETSAISADYIRTVTCGLNAAIEVLRDEVDALILWTVNSQKLRESH